MTASPVQSARELRIFLNFPDLVYAQNPYYRAVDTDTARLILTGRSAFCSHASVTPYLVSQGQRIVGRFALICDERQPEFLQVAYFEALPDLAGLAELILGQARANGNSCKKVVAGINGHLNYSAGILLDRYDQAPVCGLTYNPPYYPEYFQSWRSQTMASYRFPVEPFADYIHSQQDTLDTGGITVRRLDKRRLRQELRIYTELNNACFKGHPYWAERSPEEDWELFRPFRWFLREEYLLFAEYQGRPIGFLLWYPDFNELLRKGEEFGVRQLLRFKHKNPVRSFRFTQIGVLPHYRTSEATLALVVNLLPAWTSGYQYGEAGFIFEGNVECLNMTQRFMQRAHISRLQPYRRYAVFERDMD